MKTVRLALLALLAVAPATRVAAHDGPAPHSHGSADPRPLAAIAPAAPGRTDEEIAALLDRIEERRERERASGAAASAPAPAR